MDDSSREVDVTHLLAQYGQAMARVGQLEQEVAVLQEQVRQGTGPSHDGMPEEVARLQGELEAANEALRERDDTIASLRLQIATLNTEVAQAREQLRQASHGDGTPRVHRRRRRRSWWHRIKRRFRSS